MLSQLTAQSETVDRRDEDFGDDELRVRPEGVLERGLAVVRELDRESGLLEKESLELANACVALDDQYEASAVRMPGGRQPRRGVLRLVTDVTLPAMYERLTTWQGARDTRGAIESLLQLLKGTPRPGLAFPERELK